MDRRPRLRARRAGRVACSVAVRRPFGLPEALFGLPLAALLIVTGIEPWSAARSSARELAPTLAFLALILVFGHLCAEAGVFDYLGALAAAASRGRPTRLLAVVVAPRRAGDRRP